MLFADDGALTAPTEDVIWSLFRQWVWRAFPHHQYLQTNVMGQDVISTPSISIDDRILEKRFNTFCLRDILDAFSYWKKLPSHQVSNKDIIALAGMTSMFSLLSQRRLWWLCHIEYQRTFFMENLSLGPDLSEDRGFSKQFNLILKFSLKLGGKFCQQQL